MKKYIRNNQIAYDILSDEYEQRSHNKSKYERSAEYLSSLVLDLEQPSTDIKWMLEIGPGSGEILACFEHNGYRTIAVELSAKMALVARRKSPDTILIHGDINETDFCAEQFDVIYAGAVIHLFTREDALNLLSKFYSWLKKGGKFFVNTTISEYSDEGYFEKDDYKAPAVRFRRKWMENELRDAIEGCGFKVIRKSELHELDRNKHWVAYVSEK